MGNDNDCEHRTRRTLWERGRWAVERCEWGCGRVTLVTVQDGLTRVVLVMEEAEEVQHGNDN